MCCRGAEKMGYSEELKMKLNEWMNSCYWGWNGLFLSRVSYFSATCNFSAGVSHMPTVRKGHAIPLRDYEATMQWESIGKQPMRLCKNPHRLNAEPMMDGVTWHCDASCGYKELQRGRVIQKEQKKKARTKAGGGKAIPAHNKRQQRTATPR